MLCSSPNKNRHRLRILAASDENKLFIPYLLLLNKTCFSQIICTGDDPAVFNGTCGAESGWVPVSAVSPSILVRQIEIEKRQRSQERLPILPSPIDAEAQINRSAPPTGR